MSTLTYLLPLAICTGICNSLLTGFAAIIVLKTLLFLFRNLRSFYKYHLCNAAMLVCFISFVMAFGPLFRQMKNSNAETHITRAASTTAASPIVTIHPQPAPISLSESMSQIITQKVAVWNTAIFILYITGLLLFSVKLLWGWYQVRKLKAHATEMPGAPWNQYLSNALEKMDIRKKVIVRYSSDVLSPCITGYAKALILVPVSLCSQLTAEQAEAVLMHELAHLQHLDYFWNIITQTISTLLFFNPFVWLIARTCTRYREYACDELVKEYNGEIALSESLLAIAQFQNSGTTAALALHNNNRKQLFNRVQNLLAMKKPTRISVPSWAFTLALSFCFVLAAPSSSESQTTKKVPGKLDSAIQRAYRNGNKYFILLQAVKDGITPVTGDYNFQYRHDSVFSNEKLLSEPFQSQYVFKVKKFYADLGCKKIPDFSVRGELSENDVVDSNSDMQKVPAPSNRIIADGAKNAIDLIAAEMVQDGIADTTKGVLIEYNKNGIFVDHVQLKGASEKKYKKLLSAAEGHDPDNPEESYYESSNWVIPFSKR
ncbi:M56 family metallopeptidase [Chitinophagaceae bacterium MMS25-I14]